MVTKKTKNTYKAPQRSISDKINYYKGETRTLRTRLKYLEKRVADLEASLGKIRKQLPDDEKECIKPKQVKNTSDDFRKQFLKEHHPQHKDDKND